MKLEKLKKLMILLSILSSILYAGSSKWAPIQMGDITTFVPYGQNNAIKTLKNVYKPNALVSVKVDAALSGDEDWVGVYHKRAVSNWANEVAWRFIPNNGTFALTDGKKSMPVGNYEARLFFHNNYEEKASYPFVVSNDTFATTKTTYSPNETVSVTVNVPLSGDKDWVGIFPKNADNSWGNVIAWNWVPNKGTTTLSTKIDNKTMPAGEYEVRLFFHNSFKVEKTYGFHVGGGNAYQYGSEGAYLNQVKVDNTHDKYIVYYPEGHVKNAPVMLFFGYFLATGDKNKSNLRSEGIMRYLASLGCYVIGNKKKATAWTDATTWPSYTGALEEASNAGADTSKLGIIGHSAGAMASYYWMDKYKKAQYGKTKSFIIDLHGYFAASMFKNDLSKLVDVDSLMIAYGGLNGNANQTTHAGNTDFSENPRVLLTLSHLLPNTVKKGFIVLKTRDHMYSYGEWEEKNINGNNKYDAIKNKHDLLEPIDAMIKYEFFNDNGEYNSAENMLFGKYAQTIKDVDTATESFLHSGGNYEYKCRPENRIDYCNDYK